MLLTMTATKTKNNQYIGLMMNASMLDDDVGEIHIYGVITNRRWDEHDTDGMAVRNELRAVRDAKKLIVHVSSPGGYLDEGMYMMDEIAAHGAGEKHAILHQCCSAATLPVLACNRVSMYEGNDFMIHEPVGFTIGSYRDMAKRSTYLEKRTKEVAKLYAKKTGTPQDEIEEMMANEKWFTAEEAKEAGFVDEVLSAVAQDDTMQIAMTRGDMAQVADMLGYKHVPEQLMNRLPDEGDSAAAATDDHSSNADGDAMNNTPTTDREERQMTREELMQEYPELCNQMLQEGHASGVAEERARMQALDEIALPGCEQMITDAKYGDKPQTAEALSMQIVREQMKQGNTGNAAGAVYMSQRTKETENMNDVQGQSTEENNGDTSEGDIKAFASMADGNVRGRRV